jgi:hypothetical protein
MPSVRDGKCFCSAECEALYLDPEILKKLPVEAPADVRRRALVPLLVSLAGCIYLIWFRPASGGGRWLSIMTLLLPLFFLVEVVTGKSLDHASLWYQSLPEWKRALIMLGIMLLAFGSMASGVYLYVNLGPRF